MADKDIFDDEYQFTDLDAVNAESMPADVEPQEAEIVEETPPKIEEEPKEGSRSGPKFGTDDPVRMRRNLLVALSVIIVSFVFYKFIHAYISEKSEAVKSENLTPVAPTPQAIAPVVTQAPPPPLTASVDPKVDQKLSTLELGQQNMRSDVAAVNSQLSGIGNNVNALTTQISQLNQTVSALSEKLDAQAHEMNRLTRAHRSKPPQRAHRTPRGVVRRYYLQAVIPGRAWLIGPNGSTLTVREGTVIPGYGMVKLIDSNQGRVITSSGQVIRFSQEDS